MKTQRKTTKAMTPEETKQAAAVMIAWAEGKKVQFRYRDADIQGLWTDIPEPIWNFEVSDYRIAPEPIDFERATNALKHIRDIVAEKDANGEDIEIGSTAMKSILRWASGELKEPRQPEPMEVEVWVHPDGRIRERKYWPDIAGGEYQGWTLRRATIHPETK